MIRALVGLYRPSYPRTLVYMLQSVEYQPLAYLRWFWRTQDFGTVMKRRSLEPTRAAQLLLYCLWSAMIVHIALGLAVIYVGLTAHVPSWPELGAALLLAYPVVWAHLIIVPLLLGKVFIAGPKERALIAGSRDIFKKHPGRIVAVAGSYGKTSMKEILATVLSEALKVAVTPANKNVAVSHAAFAAKLEGDEDALVIEYGEGRPGDVASFAQNTQPDTGIITGIAPAHLDQYPTLEAAAQDIFSLAGYLKDQHVYVNGDSEAATPYIKKDHLVYGVGGVGGWKVSGIKVGFDGTRFTLKKGTRQLKLHSGLLGRHQIGPLSLAAVLGLELGLTAAQVEQGIAKTLPFEHRMQPRNLHGAWVIDDTYNGNIDGIKAGLELLKELPAQRKIYVTPGLVDQGRETEAVHRHMGELIAGASPHQVVLMSNSATPFIQKGLKAGNYGGEIVIEDDPLRFYTNLDQFLAAGDLVMMQNDWTDNYA